MSGMDKICTETCELNIVNHCNFSCRGCGHLSPVVKKYYMTASMIFRDLSILARYYHANHVRLLGGEPLLHPDLIGVIQAVRNSGICDHIRIVTNGVLLWKMPDKFWEHVDEVHVSVYPGKELADEKSGWYQKKARYHQVNFKLFHFDRFRESYSEIGTNDRTLVKRIYNTCLTAHQWHCYHVHEGYFFKCPQSIFLPRFLFKDDWEHPFIDGIKIVDSTTFLSDLLAYLESSEPLKSCKYCLGSVGKLFPYEEVSRRKWRQLQNKPSEKLIDIRYLNLLENVDADADNLCLRSHLLLPENRKIAIQYGLITG